MTGMSEYGYLRLGPHRYRERFGLSFEDLRVGMRICHRPGIDISQQDNREDAVDLLNNAQLHYDSHYAVQTEWRQPLGVSTLTVQRLLGMASRSWYRRRRLLGIDSIAMTHPVFGGDTLYSVSTVTGLDAGGDADVGRVACIIAGVNQRSEVVSEIACRFELYRRGRHPEDKPGIEPAAEERFRLYHTRPDGTLVEQTGLAFEDLVPDETFVHWPGRTFDFAESRLHALRSLEINPRWSVAAYLDQYPAIRPAIFEPLVIGAVTALTTRTLGRVVANLGWTAIELPRPVRPGETLYAESTIQDVRGSQSRPTQGIVQVETSGFASGDLVCRYQRALLVYRRGAGPYSAAGY
jgi:itaconyl-CoA hydratase